MRWALLTLLLLLVAMPAAADDDDRDTKLKRAQELHDRVVALFQAGKFREAEPLARECLRLRQEVHGLAHPDVALSMLNLGAQLTRQGRYGEARPLYEEALRIWEDAKGADHPEVGLVLNNLAMLLSEVGDHEAARPIYERLLKNWEKEFGKDHANVGFVLQGLASTLAHLGHPKEAQRLYERALKVRESTLGPEHPDVAWTLNSLGRLLHVQRAYAEARPLLERALRINEKVLGDAHPELATNMEDIALLLRDAGEYAQAQSLLERALQIRQAALGRDHPDVAHTLRSLAQVLEAQGQLEPAGRALLRSLDVIEAHVRRSLTGLSSSQRHAFARSLRAYLDRWLVLAPRLNRSGLPEVLRFKGSLARAAAAERRVARRVDEAMRKRLLAVRAAERRLAQLANSPPSFRNQARKAAWQKAYAQAAAECEALALALQRDFAPLREGLERLDLGLSDVQAQLGQDAVLVDFFRSRDQYIVWILASTGKPKRIDLGDAQSIEAAAETFAQAAVRSHREEWQQAGRTLRDLVFRPIAAHLGTAVKRIYVCPDAALATVPFAALPTDRGVLSDRYLISTVAMAQDLVPWGDVPDPGNGVFVLGGVDYGEAAVGEAEAKVEAAFVHRAPRGPAFPYLPGTKAEAEAIQDGLGAGATVLLAKEATENRLRAQAAGKRVLHLATHGFVRDDLMRGLIRHSKDREWLGVGMERQLARGHDPMLLAGLALAGANPRAGGHGDDGILTALEASHLDLDGVELVVLSACQTALGKAESGAGVIGLVQGFQMAGAKRVIGSLWKVDDEATKALMVRFYELWSPKKGKGIGAAEALRKAQEYVRTYERTASDSRARGPLEPSMARSASKRPWAHPYYWAAWVLWGPPE